MSTGNAVMLALLDEHERIRSLGKRLSGIVSEPVPAAADELARIRLHFSRAISQHFATEDRLMDEATWRRGKPPDDILASWLKQKRDRRAALSDHIRLWTPARISEHWLEYCQSVRAGLQDTEALLTFEEREIYPLAANGS